MPIHPQPTEAPASRPLPRAPPTTPSFTEPLRHEGTLSPCYVRTLSLALPVENEVEHSMTGADAQLMHNAGLQLALHYMDEKLRMHQQEVVVS